MLHFPTHPLRVQILCELGINAVSMDSIVDDSIIRLVEKMRSGAGNGIEAAFNVLEDGCPNLVRDGSPYNAHVILDRIK